MNDKFHTFFLSFPFRAIKIPAKISIPPVAFQVVNPSPQESKLRSLIQRVHQIQPQALLKKNHAPIPAKIGWVVSKTAELATEVYFGEAIQKAK